MWGSLVAGMPDDPTVPGAGARAPVPGQEEPPTSLRSAWVILAVVAGTVLSLVASALYTSRATAKLDRDAMSIATDASPAIEHLTAVREQLLLITVAAADAVERSTEGAPVEAGEFTRPLAQLYRDLGEYRKLPFYPREEILYAHIEEKVRLFEGRLVAFSTLVTAGDSRGASKALRTSLLPATAEADAGIADLTSFNAEQQHRLGMEIPKERRRTATVAFMLQLLTGLLALLLTGLVVFGARRYVRLVQAQHRAADDQAQRTAAFGAKLESIIGSCIDIAGAITSAGDPRRVLQLIADEARTIVGARYAAVGCGTDRDRPFEPWISSGMSAEAIATLGHAPRPDGILGAVAQDGRSLRLSDLRRHPLFRGLPKEHPPLGSFLGVPIIRDGRNVANLFMAREPGQQPFSAQDARAADLLAGYVAVAIENAALYDRAVAARRAREDLLATVSHDLKNPLNAIKLATHSLAGRVESEKAKQSVARIDRAADRMSGLIGDLLEAAKIEAGVLRAAPQPEDASSLIESAVEMLRPIAADKDIQLRAAAPPGAVLVLCERHLILRVFANLIGNAIKFSATGSSVSISAETTPPEVRFSVADSGPGIPAEHLAHAFERYWQEGRSDRRGSGLGLYIAKGIVEAHGGGIWIESEPGRGTNVHFTLPIARVEAQLDASPPP
jgi:signal transduction histidine kinase